MVDSLDELKSLTISFWKRFSKQRDVGREGCLGSEQDHPEFPVQKEDRFLRGRQIALDDLRLLSSDWCS